MASKIDRCVNCHVSTLTFEPFCPCMPLCAFCIEKFLKPQLYLDCQDCEREARIDDFREMVLRIDTEVEAVLGRSLGLRRDNQCPSCSSPLHPENRVFFPCKDHFICFPCFNNLVDKALTSNRLLRCSDLHCNQEAFYYLSDFNGRLRIEQINRYDELVLKKSNIRQNKAKLEAMSQKFARCLHREGNNDPAQLRSMLESIANCTNIFEFRVTFTAREIRRCALAGCDNKVYDFQRVALPSSEEYACSLRCLQMHYLQLGADATSLKTKTGVLISKSALVISLPEGCFVATCDICYSDFLSFELSSLECHHPVCSSCLSDHISTLIIELKVDEDQFTCPRLNCTCTIPPQMVQKLFPRGNTFDRFLRMRFEKMTKLSDSEID